MKRIVQWTAQFPKADERANETDRSYKGPLTMNVRADIFSRVSRFSKNGRTILKFKNVRRTLIMNDPRANETDRKYF